MTKKIKIIKMNVDVITVSGLLASIKNFVGRKVGAYVCLSNVHMCMEVNDSEDFENVINHADIVVADGRPIFWAQRLLGSKTASQVRGIDLMKALCMLASQNNFNVGLYGGYSNNVLDDLKSILRNSYPRLNISYAFSPPFRDLENKEKSENRKKIESCEVDILFVGIGCPKQEFWMASNKDELKCVMVGVGAAFDFIVGNKRQAPRWVQYFGLEWLSRLISEPKRLWRRYLIQNTRFIFYFIRQLIVINFKKFIKA